MRYVLLVVGVFVVAMGGIYVRVFLQRREEDVRFRSRPWDQEASDRLDRLRVIARRGHDEDQEFYARR
jgi:hypothetical protein